MKDFLNFMSLTGMFILFSASQKFDAALKTVQGDEWFKALASLVAIAPFVACCMWFLSRIKKL